MRELRSILFIILLGTFIAGAAKGEEVTALDRFQLWNDCDPVKLGVGVFDPTSMSRMKLLNERIETTVRSRLRIARMYQEGIGPPMLFIQVTLLEAFYLVLGDVSFYKHVLEYRSNESAGAPTWRAGGVVGFSLLNTLPSDNGAIVSAVTEKVDIFIDEYLRVNADSCAR